MSSLNLPAVAGTLSNPAHDLRAACRDHSNPDLWFPHPADDRTEAVSICHACPVRMSCLQWAIAARQSGIWGGELLDRGRPEGANTKWRNPYPLVRAAS